MGEKNKQKSCSLVQGCADRRKNSTKRWKYNAEYARKQDNKIKGKRRQRWTAHREARKPKGICKRASWIYELRAWLHPTQHQKPKRIPTTTRIYIFLSKHLRTFHTTTVNTIPGRSLCPTPDPQSFLQDPGLYKARPLHLMDG